MLIGATVRLIASRLLAIVGLSSALVSLGMTTPTSVGELLRVSTRVRAFAGKTLWESRALLYGEPFTHFLAEALQQIRRNESYLLASGPPGNQGENLVRLQLLPRVPRRYGSFRSRSSPAWIVWVGRDGEAPVLERPSSKVKSSLGVRRIRGPSDEGILGAIDLPPEDATVTGETLTVQGWCQELGGKPCPEVLFALDGQTQEDPVERYPREDVRNAIAGIGDCSKAGYRFVVDARGLRRGSHVIEIQFLTADGRHRRLHRSFTR